MFTPAFALLVGFIPSVLWLIFWLSADRKHHEPVKLLLDCFIFGAVSVLVAKFAEQGLKMIIVGSHTQLIIFAVIEEVLKFLVFYFIAYNGPYDHEPIEPAIYMIVTALGFAALENILYVIQPSVITSTSAIVLTGGLRFFGSTLLHAIASGFVGVLIGISRKRLQPIAIIIGLMGAIFLHVVFNFFISTSHQIMNVVQIYALLLVTALVGHLVLERLRKIPFTI